MKYIFLNLKRFDIQRNLGGVNSLVSPAEWGSYIAGELKEGLCSLAEKDGLALRDYQFPVFFPEAHLIPAGKALESKDHSSGEAPIQLGCQSIYSQDVEVGGNFGAFTSLRTASAMQQLNCQWVIIGHSEERRAKASVMALAGAEPDKIISVQHQLLNQEIRCAQKAGLKVLYCIGESAEDLPRRREVLQRQLEEGLSGVDTSNVVLGYEPLWAIGPGKTPPTADQIAQVTAEVKSLCPCPVVYGGGLKKENAQSIGSIKELDGGLIALTRFTGDIGFYPQEYLEIVSTYVKGTGDC
ncbi:MAG: triose-phosphate isomerase family protein [Treponema sp.]|nr:triose-phosphate isomerase family protein [Treponema sp.]